MRINRHVPQPDDDGATEAGYGQENSCPEFHLFVVQIPVISMIIFCDAQGAHLMGKKDPQTENAKASNRKKMLI